MKLFRKGFLPTKNWLGADNEPSLCGPIAEVRQGMTELVRELKAVLGPMSVLGRQADRDAAGRRPLEIGLRMIGTIIDVDSAELSSRAVAPKFKSRQTAKGP